MYIFALVRNHKWRNPQNSGTPPQKMRTKMKRTIAYVCAALLMLGSCASSNQLGGTITGASLGGIFGSAIGGLMGGPRGSDAGTALGMILGGAAGAAATAPKQESRNSESSLYDNDAYGQQPQSRPGNGAYGQRGKGGHADESRYYTYRPSQIEGLQIENIRFVDASHDQVLQPGESAKIVFNIYNRGNQTLYNVTPIISVNKKQVSVSPAAIVSELRPGKGCTYTAAVLTSPRLRTGTVTFVIGFQDGNEVATFKTFDIATRRP